MTIYNLTDKYIGSKTKERGIETIKGMATAFLAMKDEKCLAKLIGTMLADARDNGGNPELLAKEIGLSNYLQENV